MVVGIMKYIFFEEGKIGNSVMTTSQGNIQI